MLVSIIKVRKQQKICLASRLLFTYSFSRRRSLFLSLLSTFFTLLALPGQSISIAAICWSIVINCTNAYIGVRRNQSALWLSRCLPLPIPRSPSSRAHAPTAHARWSPVNYFNKTKRINGAHGGSWRMSGHGGSG